MIEAVRNFKLPYGTIGDLIDNTPKDKISRVYLEDKLFETWTHGRTVLIGDAAHKVVDRIRAWMRRLIPNVFF